MFSGQVWKTSKDLSKVSFKILSISMNEFIINTDLISCKFPYANIKKDCKINPPYPIPMNLKWL